MRTTCSGILLVQPDSDRTVLRIQRLEDAGCTVIHATTADAAGACTAQAIGCELVVVDGCSTGYGSLAHFGVPILLVPDQIDDEEVLALVASAGRGQAESATRRYDDTIIRELLATSPDHISFKDLYGRFTRISSSLVPVFGLENPEDAVGLSDFDFYPEERARGFFEEEQRMIRGGPPIINRLAEYHRRDGTVVKGLVTKMPLRDSGGTVIGTYGVSRNVTELMLAEDRIRRLLEEKELLLREIHHRVKNDFSIARSLLQLQADSAGNAQTAHSLHEAASRMAVMARTYDQMNIDGDANAVSLQPMVDELLRDVAATVSSALSIQASIDDLRAPPRVAVAIGILLNELCTNAVKHAFTGACEPVLSVEIHPTSDARVTVRFADNGSGYTEEVRSGSRRGHGLTIVNALLEQHGGDLKLSNDGGAVAECTLRLE